MKVSCLKPAPYNPRIISENQLKMLEKSLERFGDLSGIVFNRRTKNIIGGHQRIKCFPSDAKIVKKELDKPSRTGTVAEGYIEIDNERFAYREVDWDETTEKLANIAANKHGGDWDFLKLESILIELSNLPDLDLDLTGFDIKEIENIIKTVDVKSNQLELKSKPLSAIYQVVVDCSSEQEQEQVFNLLTKQGYKCRLLIL